MRQKLIFLPVVLINALCWIFFLNILQTNLNHKSDARFQPAYLPDSILFPESYLIPLAVPKSTPIGVFTASHILSPVSKTQ